jgi:hypothetical protein
MIDILQLLQGYMTWIIWVLIICLIGVFFVFTGPKGLSSIQKVFRFVMQKWYIFLGILILVLVLPSILSVTSKVSNEVYNYRQIKVNYELDKNELYFKGIENKGISFLPIDRLSWFTYDNIECTAFFDDTKAKTVVVGSLSKFGFNKDISFYFDGVEKGQRELIVTCYNNDDFETISDTRTIMIE